MIHDSVSSPEFTLIMSCILWFVLYWSLFSAFVG